MIAWNLSAIWDLVKMLEKLFRIFGAPEQGAHLFSRGRGVVCSPMALDETPACLQQFIHREDTPRSSRAIRKAAT